MAGTRAGARAKAVRRPSHGATTGPLERGSATPVMVAILAVVIVCTTALAQVGAGLISGARASGAADLVALASARQDRDLRAAGVRPTSALAQACQLAHQVAARNAASLVSCVRGADSSVIVSVAVPVPGWPHAATAHARAGAAWSAREVARDNYPEAKKTRRRLRLRDLSRRRAAIRILGPATGR